MGQLLPKTFSDPIPAQGPLGPSSNYLQPRPRFYFFGFPGLSVG